MNLLVLFSWKARRFLGFQTIRGVKFRTFLLWFSNSLCRTNNVREYFTLSIVLDLIHLMFGISSVWENFATSSNCVLFTFGLY